MHQGTLWGRPIGTDRVRTKWVKEPKQVRSTESRQITDPRPDLKYDSDDWTRLLTMVEEECISEFVWLLHGFRCAGLRLHRGRNGYVFRPDYDQTSMWHSEKEYIADRDKWLVPWQHEIIKYLRRLTQERAKEVR